MKQIFIRVTRALYTESITRPSLPESPAAETFPVRSVAFRLSGDHFEFDQVTKLAEKLSLIRIIRSDHRDAVSLVQRPFIS